MAVAAEEAGVGPAFTSQGAVCEHVGRIRLPAQSVDGLAILASTTIMADAASAAVMAILSRPNSFRKALTFVDGLEHVQGAVVVQGRRIGVAGAVELAA